MTIEEERNKKALEIAANYGWIDGTHHKMWVIDQMVRALTNSDFHYAQWTDAFAYWDIGIAP